MTDSQTMSRSRVGRAAPVVVRGSGGAIFLLSFLGALVFFWSQADTGGERVLAILKAVVWPAYLVFGALQTLFP